MGIIHEMADEEMDEGQDGYSQSQQDRQYMAQQQMAMRRQN